MDDEPISDETRNTLLKRLKRGEGLLQAPPKTLDPEKAAERAEEDIGVAAQQRVAKKTWEKQRHCRPAWLAYGSGRRGRDSFPGLFGK